MIDNLFVICLFCLLVFSNAMTILVCRWLLDAERNYSEALENQLEDIRQEKQEQIEQTEWKLIDCDSREA